MSQEGPVCVNIGRQGINQRRMLGVWMLFIGIVLAGILLATQQPWLVRAVVFVPFFFGFLGILQASWRTCVFLALRGQQHLGERREDILDVRTKQLLWYRSVRILLTSALLAAAATAVVMYVYRPDQ